MAKLPIYRVAPFRRPGREPCHVAELARAGLRQAGPCPPCSTLCCPRAAANKTYAGGGTASRLATLYPRVSAGRVDLHFTREESRTCRVSGYEIHPCCAGLKQMCPCCAHSSLCAARHSAGFTLQPIGCSAPRISSNVSIATRGRGKKPDADAAVHPPDRPRPPPPPAPPRRGVALRSAFLHPF